MPLHDLTIKTIAEYLVNNNEILHKLIRLNKRFYSIRLYFIKNMWFDDVQSHRLYKSRPEYWNYVHRLYFVGFETSLLDISLLTRLHTLSLDQCNNMVNIASLGKIRYLKLYYCDQIEDVSVLGTVYDLTICNCKKVKDVSGLGSVHRLNLIYCDAIEDVSALGTVYNLSFNTCAGIKDISALDKVLFLTIYCTQLPYLRRRPTKNIPKN